MRTTGKATDLITFSRSSGGTALRKIAYGPELVTNGTFDTDTSGWVTTSGSLASVSGRGELTNSGAVSALSSSSFNTVAGKVYQVFAEVENTTALSNCRIYVGTTSGGINLLTINTPNGDTNLQTVAGVFVATGSTTYVSVSNRAINNAVAYYDNISVKEVLFDQGDLTLFNHPADIPRIEYDANGNFLGLLVEESRTNLVTYSEDFTDSYWSKLNSGNGSVPVLTANYATAPDGRSTATRLQASISSDGASDDYSLVQRAFSPLSGNHTASIWVKSNTSETQEVYFRVGVTETKSVTTEWTRISTTTGATTAYLTIGVRNADGNPNLDILIWGAQFEAGAFPTSYIPTSGSTATRAADVASKATSEFGYRDDEGTVVIEYGQPPAVLVDGYSVGGFQITSAQAGLAHYHGSGNISYFYSGTNRVSVYTGDEIAGKIAMYYDAVNDEAGGSYQGNAVASIATPGLTGAFPSSSYTKFNIGVNAESYLLNTLNGHIKSIKYIPRRLTNDQLQEITS